MHKRTDRTAFSFPCTPPPVAWCRRCCRVGAASGDKAPVQEAREAFPRTARQPSLSQPVAYKTNHRLVPTPADPGPEATSSLLLVRLAVRGTAGFGHRTCARPRACRPGTRPAYSAAPHHGLSLGVVWCGLPGLGTRRQVDGAGNMCSAHLARSGENHRIFFAISILSSNKQDDLRKFCR
jgi:hypothetical protein